MAEIFLATQLGREGFQKLVILKRIHSAIYADPQFRNMFIDEAHISMGLSHSNIVQILDLGVGSGRYFLVMEVVDGWDLGRVLQRAAMAETPLPRELGLHVTAEVCRALAYAHGKMDAAGERPLGIVHRDVSPQNILLSEQGEVKLTDFGIAKAMGKREQTGTGVVKGKVAFMAPEQALGKTIDARSDLYALGKIISECLLGQHAVHSVSHDTRSHGEQDFERAVRSLCSTLLSPDPADRPLSALDVSVKLRNLSMSDTVRHCTPSWTKHVSPSLIRFEPEVQRICESIVKTSTESITLPLLFHIYAIPSPTLEALARYLLLRLFRNGSLVKVWHGDVLRGKTSVLDATLPIVAGDNNLTAYAFNRDNVKSSDATLTVKGAESAAAAISRWGFPAAPYHGRLPDASRRRIQDGFAAKELRVVVATSAFGMGVDFPDIRQVIDTTDHAGGTNPYYQPSK